MFLSFTGLIIGQNGSKLERNLYKVNIINPGFTFEKSLTNSTSANLDANLSFGFTVNNNKTTILTAPFLRGQYRYYYNLKKRVAKGKDISNNSGGFLALNSSYYFKPVGNDVYISSYDGFTFGGVWGFQKTYKSGINLSANTGLGYNISDKQSQKMVPLLNFTLGWIIGK